MDDTNEQKQAPYLVEVTTHYGDVEATTAYLAEKHSEGWDLVCVEGTTFYFKAAV